MQISGNFPKLMVKKLPGGHPIPRGLAEGVKNPNPDFKSLHFYGWINQKTNYKFFLFKIEFMWRSKME